MHGVSLIRRVQYSYRVSWHPYGRSAYAKFYYYRVGFALYGGVCCGFFRAFLAYDFLFGGPLRVRLLRTSLYGGLSIYPRVVCREGRDGYYNGPSRCYSGRIRCATGVDGRGGSRYRLKCYLRFSPMVYYSGGTVVEYCRARAASGGLSYGGGGGGYYQGFS